MLKFAMLGAFTLCLAFYSIIAQLEHAPGQPMHPSVVNFSHFMQNHKLDLAKT